MYHRTVFMTGFLALAIFLLAAAPQSRAEDLSSALRSAEQIQTNLQAIIAAQDEAHAHELAYFQHELDSLKTLVGRLVQYAQRMRTSDSLLLCLSDDVAHLQQENQYLAGLLQVSLKQYASTDDETFGDSSLPKLGDLTTLLADLNDNLNDIIEKRNAELAPAEEPTSGLTYYGWIDVSHSAEYNTNKSDFNLDQAELDLSTDVAERGSLRADVEYVSDYAGGFNLNLEQAYFNYSLTSAGNLSVTVGKFNAPVGWEVVDPENVYLYTYSLVRECGLPMNLVGVSSDWAPTSVVDVKLWVANGWDQNTDNNNDKTFGARFGLTPVDNFTVRLSGLYGPEQDKVVSSKRSVIDADLTWTPLERVTFAGDVTLGNETHLPGNAGIASWSGAMLLSRLAVTSKLTLFSRFDYFNDEDGTRTGFAQEWKAIALSPDIQVTDAFSAGVELRYDWSNRDTYSTSGGTARNNRVSSAVQFTYGF